MSDSGSRRSMTAADLVKLSAVVSGTLGIVGGACTLALIPLIEVRSTNVFRTEFGRFEDRQASRWERIEAQLSELDQRLRSVEINR